MVEKQCPATMFDRAVSHDTRCRNNAGHVGRHDDGCLSWPEPSDPLREVAEEKLREKEEEEDPKTSE